MEIIKFDNLTFSYPDSGINALENICLSIEKGSFNLLIGSSGSGKTTLLKMIKPELAPFGKRKGIVYFENKDINELTDTEKASKIGYVMQSVENQVVTDKVWHELAFGLESLGVPKDEIRTRVAEMAAFFGISKLFRSDVATLSGGQLQLLNLASVMVMRPEVIVLDEPTSQLDPIAASGFLEMLYKINKELGTTVILSEHRLEEAMVLADRIFVLEEGSLVAEGSLRKVSESLKKSGSSLFMSLPTPMRVWEAVETSIPCPASVSEGKAFLEQYLATKGMNTLEETLDKPSDCTKSICEESSLNTKTLISIDNAFFRYEKNLPDVLCGVSLDIIAGDFLAILGENGCGKSTLLKLMCGLIKPYRGRVKCEGKAVLLPQNPGLLFAKKTLGEELIETAESFNENDKAKVKVERIASMLRLEHLLERHPYDLSGGEKQRAGIAKLLLADPDIFLLDEPTKGLDAGFKVELADIIKSLTDSGVCVVMVSHDVEFSAEYANKVAMLFDGDITSMSEPSVFFSNNRFFTTAARRMSEGIFDNTITTNEVIDAIGGRRHFVRRREIKYGRDKGDNPKGPKRENLPIWRKIGAGIFGVISAVLFATAMKQNNLSELVKGNRLTHEGMKSLGMYGLLIASVLAVVFLLSKKDTGIYDYNLLSGKLSARSKIAIALVLLAVPVTLFVSVYYFDTKQYYVTATLILFESMAPFFIGFEGRKPKARELVIIAVLCALGVAGRAAFFMFPQFKPVMAVTIIAGMAFGAEAGFLVGSVTMLVSNIMFSQGPWTPWQMFAMGIIGFLGGILYKKGAFCRRRLSVSLFGFVAAILIYGGIMNPVSVLIFAGPSLSLKLLLTYYLTGFPMDLIHAVATFIFLWLLEEPMLEKLDRVKDKYGLNIA